MRCVQFHEWKRGLRPPHTPVAIDDDDIETSGVQFHGSKPRRIRRHRGEVRIPTAVVWILARLQRYRNCRRILQSQLLGIYSLNRAPSTLKMVPFGQNGLKRFRPRAGTLLMKRRKRILHNTVRIPRILRTTWSMWFPITTHIPCSAGVVLQTVSYIHVQCELRCEDRESFCDDR